MAKRQAAAGLMAESDFLRRLRKGVQISGVNADLSALSPQEQAIVVTNRLAQTTVRYLTNEVDPVAGQRLSEELRMLTSPGEYELLMEDRGYTFYHVVQFLYEFAKTYADIPDREYFCAGMGRGGGGVEVAPHTEVVSLVHLLITALSPANDRRNLGVLMQELAPPMLSQIFTAGLFDLQVVPEQEDRLCITLQYTDRDRVEACLRAFGLGGDIGAFFRNSALHIEGLLQLAWETFAQDSERSVEMTVRVENRNEAAREEIRKACSCTWSVTWKPEVRLNRLSEDAEILTRMRTVYEALNQKDLEYYLERIKSLKMRVQSLEEGGGFHGLIGGSARMRRVYQTIEQVAASDLTVLIRGETGTGKDLAARAIHKSSSRRDRPFVAVNCAAFSETLLESELFGHEKGAFTGADREKPGRFELADGSTLFLDEVGDIPLTTQVKLLRVLETQAFERVGGTETIQTDVRIVGATHRDLEGMIARGEFREDFFFRLHVLPVRMPSLRENREDIPLLAQHFLERAAARSNKEAHGFSRGAMERLLNHSWPGNNRDLQNAIERAVVVYARGPTLTESNVAQSLGIQDSGMQLQALNMRQRQVLEAIGRSEGCTVEDLMEGIESEVRGGGRSRRTLQNDLRRLADMDYVDWTKQGSARRYEVMLEGEEVLRKLSGR